MRLENLDTGLRPPQVALEGTHAAVDRDDTNGYLPFQGHPALREAACAHVAAAAGRSYDPGTRCVSVAGGLNGILNVLLATVEPGQEVVICDPVCAGLVNRIRLAGGVPRFGSGTPGPGGWVTGPGGRTAARLSQRVSPVGSLAIAGIFSARDCAAAPGGFERQAPEAGDAGGRNLDQHFGHVRLDRFLPGGSGDRDAVVAVHDEVQVPDAVHVDRRKGHAAPLLSRA